MTTTTTRPTIGDMVRVDDVSDEASYIGEVVALAGDRITLQDYAAWYAETTEPYNSGPTDQVTIRITETTVVITF